MSVGCTYSTGITTEQGGGGVHAIVFGRCPEVGQTFPEFLARVSIEGRNAESNIV